MYNRYIPQPDGSYRRRSVPDPAFAQQSGKSTPRQQGRPQPPPPPREACPPPPQQDCPTVPAPPQQKPSPQRMTPRQEQDAGSFLRQLLPKDFCTEDLIVVLLLLLMAGNTQEGKNNALLTLALYLFL